MKDYNSNVLASQDPKTLRQQSDPKLIVFDTHPIQYRSPVLRELYARHPLLNVYLFNEKFDGDKWWFHQRHQTPAQEWNLPLLEGFPSQFIGTAQLTTFQTYRKLNQILDQEKPTAVLVFGYFTTENWVLWLCCWLRGIRLLFLGDTFRFENRKLLNPLKRLLITLFFSKVGKFIASGERNYQYYREMNIDPSRIVKANYCVDTTFFGKTDTDSAQSRRKWRNEHNIDQAAFILLYVGRLAEIKRPHDLLEIHRGLQNHPKFHTVIIGNGPLEEQLRASASVLNHIHFLGFQSQDLTREAYHAADLLILPSKSETWGFVVSEAFACGCPAIVTDTCGVAGDLVLHNHTGLIYPPGRVDTAVKTIEPFVQNSTPLRRMGGAAKERLNAEFSIDQFVSALLRAIKLD